jgi:dipeptidyl aminopeptidase/acylaminoacyl peptidase
VSRFLGVDDIEVIAVPEQPAISPDGESVVYVLRTNDVVADRTVRRLHVVSADGSGERQITDGPSDSTPTWSPDSRTIAFLRTDGGPSQIWLVDVDGGNARQLTEHRAGAGAPSVSPDGSRILFSAPAQPADGDDRDHWAWGAPIVSERLDYYADGDGTLTSLRRHAHLVDVASGEIEQLTDGDWNAVAPAWSPDGSAVAFAAAIDPDADLTRASGVYVLDLGDSTRSPRLVGSGKGVAGPLGWTPDASRLIVCGNEDGPARFTGLLSVPLDGGPTENLTAPLDRNVMYGAPGYPGSTPRIVPDLDVVLFCMRAGGYVRAYSTPIGGGAATELPLGDAANISSLTVAGTRVALARSTSESFGEIVVLDLATGASTQLSRWRESLAEIAIAERVSREFVIGDGARVEGWVMRDGRAVGPQPLLLDIHGGPHNAWNGAAEDIHLYHHELVSRGWTVLLLNPRGSDGYGESFALAVSAGWGTSDAQDFLEPIDELVADGLVDPRRVAVTGYSYGGYMTCFLTSRSDRFAAAVGGGVISDVTSAAGTTDNRRGLTETEWGGAFWDHPDNYAAMSPLTHVADVTTPTLLLHGGADVRCPLDQARQWHTALRERGVPTQIVIYPNASHDLLFNSPPRHRRDYNRRVVEWVTRFAG